MRFEFRGIKVRPCPCVIEYYGISADHCSNGCSAQFSKHISCSVPPDGNTFVGYKHPSHITIGLVAKSFRNSKALTLVILFALKVDTRTKICVKFRVHSFFQVFPASLSHTTATSLPFVNYKVCIRGPKLVASISENKPPISQTPASRATFRRAIVVAPPSRILAQ